MNASYSVKWILVGAFLMPGLTACSFFGDDEEKAEEVAASDEADPADASNSEASAEENNEGDAMASAEDPGAPVADDSALNAMPTSDAADPTMANADIPPELLANTEAPLPPPPPPALEGGMDAAMAAPPPPAAPAFTPPSGDMRVYYVNASALQLRDRPDGQAVGKLSMGDPVLVKIEGNWANVLNRGWVELASLSMGPVGRSKLAKSWN